MKKKPDTNLITTLIESVVTQQQLIGEFAVKIADLTLLLGDILPKCESTGCDMLSVGQVYGDSIKHACKSCLNDARQKNEKVEYSTSSERIERLESTIHLLRKNGYYDPGEMN